MAEDKGKGEAKPAKPKQKLPPNQWAVADTPKDLNRKLRELENEAAAIEHKAEARVKEIKVATQAKTLPIYNRIAALADKARKVYGLSRDHIFDTAARKICIVHDPRLAEQLYEVEEMPEPELDKGVKVDWDDLGDFLEEDKSAGGKGGSRA